MKENSVSLTLLKKDTFLKKETFVACILPQKQLAKEGDFFFHYLKKIAQ